MLFEEIADMGEILLDHLVVTHDNKRVFAAATPDSLGIWAEVDFGTSLSSMSLGAWIHKC
jgi:hypothetical protein